MIMKRGFQENQIKSYLNRISKLKKQNLETITNEYHGYLINIPLDLHFEVIYKHFNSSTSQEIYIKKLSKISGATGRAITSDYKAYYKLKESEKQREKDKAFPLLLEETFELGYTPYIGSAYKEDHNVLLFKTDYDDIRLCNIFVPTSKIISEINGKSKTHIKILMRYKNRNIELIESS